MQTNEPAKGKEPANIRLHFSFNIWLLLRKWQPGRGRENEWVRPYGRDWLNQLNPINLMHPSDCYRSHSLEVGLCQQPFYSDHY